MFCYEQINADPARFLHELGVWHYDQLARWTNDRWISTLHRVVPPPPDSSGAVRRRSIARFLDCPPDLVVETIPSCVDDEHPARYEPVNAGEWLRADERGAGRIDLPSFWARRARRLLPGLFVVLAAVTLAFLALPVIPELKLTDKGLVDVGKFDFVAPVV